MKTARADDPDSIVLADSWTNSEMRPYDRVVLVDSFTKRFAITTVRTVSEGRKAMRIQLGAGLAQLEGELGRGAGHSRSGVVVYRYAPSNDDFVYRRNRHVGGRGHGVKFNGTRGWIADNHFENVTGNSIHVGFTYIDTISGVGARDVVVSGNTINYSGWTPITRLSTSGIGGNILIRDNHVIETREAAIAIQGCNDVRIVANAFASSEPPKQGAWTIAQEEKALWTSGNTHISEVPLMKSVNPSK